MFRFPILILALVGCSTPVPNPTIKDDTSPAVDASDTDTDADADTDADSDADADPETAHTGTPITTGSGS